MSNVQFRNRVKAGELLSGLITNFNSDDDLEFLGGSGLDYVIVDGEHGAIGIESIARMVRTLRSVGIPAIVRVQDANPKTILQTCDAGADGIMVPQVEHAEVAGRLCDSLCYPPTGSRGLHGGTPAADWGRRSLTEHIECENTGICSIVQIETAGGVDAADAILSTPGVDAVIVGPTDLSISLGYPGEIGHDAVWEATEKVFRTAQEHGVACGGLAQTEEQVDRLRRIGASILLGNLPSCLADGVRAFLTRTKAARAVTSS